MANLEPISGSDEREETRGDHHLVALAERLMREPELVEWLGADPPPAPWTDDDPPRAA
jgi:hypothetical protein